MKKLIEMLRAKGASDEEIVKALAEDGHSEEAIAKAMATELAEDEMEKALAELDELEKSEDDEDDLDSLIKALEDEEADLEKSDGEDDEGDDYDEEEGVEKSEDDDVMDELVKASEAYADLEKSIHASMGDIRAEMHALSKAQLIATNLQIKTAKAVAALAKSVQETIAQTPAGPSRGKLGIGSAQGETEIKKSKADIRADLTKAVEEKRVNAQYLSIFAVRGAEALPDFVKKEIGL